MQRLLLSLAVVVAVGGAVAASTGAFFSDTETSTGNTFTAGSMVLQVDDSQHYAGLVCTSTDQGATYHWAQDPTIGPNPTTRPELLGTPCTGTWNPGPLGPSTKFFNFSDLKPGDPGENTISLHVSNNAWACLNIGTNVDNGLASNITVFAWNDNGTTTGATPGDNVYNPAGGDTPLFGGNGTVTLSSFGATTTIPLADSVTGSQLLASTTNYIGVAWCFGSTTVSGPTITCNGSQVGNGAQNTSASATVQFNVVQSRNNPNFRCIPPS